MSGELSKSGRRMRRTSMFMETSYVDRILEQAGMSTCKAAPTPGTDALKRGTGCTDAPGAPAVSQLVGQLWWMGNLRMDIMHAIKELSRRLASPSTDHWAKLKHLLRYLRGTKDYVQELCPKLRLCRKSIPHLVFTLTWTTIGPVILTRVGRLLVSPRTCRA